MLPIFFIFTLINPLSAFSIENNQQAFNKTYLKALMSIKENKWENALVLFDELSEFDLKKPAEFHYSYGKVLVKNNYNARALNSLNEYIESTGTQGKYYNEAFQLLQSADENNGVTYSGVRKFPDDSIYEGEFVEGRINGQGKMIWQDKDSYQGEWEKEFRTGKGKYISPALGMEYEGEFERNNRHGKGVLKWQDGAVYQGEFYKNEIQGEGTLTTPQGDKYVGAWKDNKRNGRGQQTFADGSRLDGVFENDVFVSGNFYRIDSKKLSDGSTYKGWMRNDEPEGNGSVTFPNFDNMEIVGAWKGSLLNGKVKISWPDGSSFEGHYESGYLKGDGVYIFADGVKLIAKFLSVPITAAKNIAGKTTGNVRIIFTSKTTYEGEIVNFKFHGRGILDKEDYRYEGDFKENIFHGNGKLTFKTGDLKGDVYSGHFVNGRQTGIGTYIFANGSTYHGGFVDGVFSGKGRYAGADGLSYIGDFLNGDINGLGEMTYPDGRVDTGNFVNGDLHGRGKSVFPNGDIYLGDYIKGARSGKGIYTWWDSGDTYRGNWLNGARDGYGWYITAKGKTTKGYWKNDQLADKCSLFQCKNDPLLD